MSDKTYEYRRIRDRDAGRPRMVPAAVTHRKVNALRAMGWSAAVVGERLEVTQQAMSAIMGRDMIRASTAARIDGIYRQLEMAIPPDTQYVRRTRNAALREGHHPPLAWVDIEAGVLARVERRSRAPRGRLDMDEVEFVLQHNAWRHPLSPPERAEVVRRWVANGGSINSLRALSGWKPQRYYKTEE